MRPMTTLTRILLIVPLFLASISVVRPQTMSKEQREILELQDSRSLGNGKLVSYLQSKDKYLRYRAAIALGNIQDTSTVAPLVPLLQDEDLQVRAAAAFALGQIGSEPAVRSLIGALRSDQDMQVLARICEALGKCGNADALNSVVDFIPSAKNIAVKRFQALSIARFALRRITSERGVWLCFDLLKDNHAETRSAAMYALWRCAPLGVIDVEISNRAYLLVTLMRDEDADVRINLATLLGKTKSEEAPRLIKMFQEVDKQSPDWRVEVQLARSAGMLAGSEPSLLEILLSDLNSSNDHVKIASLTTLASLDTAIIAASDLRERLLATIQHLAATPSRTAILVQGEALVALGKQFPDQLTDLRLESDNKVSQNLVRAKYFEALSYQPSETNIWTMLDGVNDDSVRVAMAAWDFLRPMIQPRVLQRRDVDRSFVDSIPSLLVPRMERGLRRNDLAITTLVANLFSGTAILSLCSRAGYSSAISNDLRTAYLRLSSSDDAEAMVAVQRAFVSLHDSSAVPVLEKSLSDQNQSVAVSAAEALRRITGRNYSSQALAPSIPTRPESDWKMLESIKAFQRVLFKTTKGSFTIRLHKEDAPFTVLAFFKLVSRKFYNGLTFHRVVPDFVIQGGDPRGDGWGGPGFTIRSEFSLANFERGSVGMASSGKDTEGCQFFITHIPTPHLDGRYTLFATVTSGMDVVDRIQVGDKILSAEIR